MADSRPALPPVKTGACFRVAELIDYAQGSISPDERTRIEAHVKDTRCGYCRRWIAAAGSESAAKMKTAAGKWTRAAAFQDLKQRLEMAPDV